MLSPRDRSESESVVLLHGMGRSWLSMAVLGLRFRRVGYEVHLFGYRPRDTSLDDITRTKRKSERGATLLEVLVALAITLIVMGLVAQTMSHVEIIVRSQTRLATTANLATLSFDDMLGEIARAGQGLGEDVPAVVPRLPGGTVTPDAITLRSNPTARAARLLAGRERGASAAGTRADVFVEAAGRFERSETVLVTDGTGRAETAEVLRVDGSGLDLRSLETRDGELRYRYAGNGSARLLALREVRYHVDSQGALVKEGPGERKRVLARGIESLLFEYLDADGTAIATARVESGRELAMVRVTVRYRSERAGMASEERVLVSGVGLAPCSGTIDFERPTLDFRLSRVFYPIQRPVAVAARPGRDWAAILSGGLSPTQDPAYLYTFPVEEEFLGAREGDLIWLDDVRAPLAMTFGPEAGPLRGALFVAAWGLRIGHLSRLDPDSSGTFSSESESETFEGTEAIAQAGGIAFGVDGALYVTSREKGAVFRFRFDASGRPSRPERVFAVTGTPGAIAEGPGGHLYFLMNQGDRGSLWKMAFDETLAPVEPALVGPLPGTAISLARDPVEGNLFALVRTPIGDFHVLEVRSGWIRERERGGRPELPDRLFSLAEWQTKLEEGNVAPRALPFPPQELPRRMAELRTDELDFLGFDDFGSLYLGAQERDLVLKFELDRPSGRHEVGLAATVEEDLDGNAVLRLHSWKKRP